MSDQNSPLYSSLKNNRPQKAIAYSRAIHLSQIIHQHIPRWDNDPPVEFTTVAQLETDGYYI